ncbi:regulatory protein NosR [Marinobacterium zhoushanense]|uniref:Regulatory protein NosR n=1 Tax=Marinobacterium zhoushanense TaxID=1679163 RepID=A0ABQ1JZ62_9GAMM|nr:NosR/NirI family protein [Marinobacterium zhoushanense]GGB79942.1 regulatory protein NosR [Marinobacterium zhoushanense]
MQALFQRWSHLLLLLMPLWLATGVSQAEPLADEQDMPALIKQIFPQATEIKPQLSDPPVWPVYQVTELIGYAFLSGDYVQLPGFSGAPYQLLIGIDRDGIYRGVRVLEHHEPIFLHGLGPEPMHRFTEQYPGLDLRQTIKITSAAVRNKASGSNVYIDGITKATASAIVLNESVMLSAVQAAQQLGLIPHRRTPAQVRADLQEPANWSRLVNEQWARELKLSEAKVDSAFANQPAAEPDTGDSFVELYFTYLNAPTIGRYLLGDEHYTRLIEQKLEPGEHAIAVLNTGPYSILGDSFVRGTPPDRLALEQNGIQIELRDLDFYSAVEPQLPADLPYFDEVRLFRIKSSAGFDPASPWTLKLVVSREQGYLRPDTIRTFAADYLLPERFFIISEQETVDNTPLWLQIWQQRAGKIAALLLGLTLLTAIILGHRWVTADARRFRLIRWGYLLYTLVFIGYITQGQLSITNLFTILQVVSGKVSGSILLIDPVIAILWCYVLLTLLLWGRGYFCGWLCPFGVLQEMVAELATRLKIRQKRIPWHIHRRVWGLKYVILAGLVVVSFYSLSAAERGAEVEPFKTAITMGFVREWPFVIYTGALLLAGLFVHKFFCRYLCPLGAAFAVLGHFHLFRWLPRRAECGSPCQLCTHRCGIRAIAPSGKINYRECIQCYECEVIYRDNHQCVPLINERKGKRKPSQLIAKAS